MSSNVTVVSLDERCRLQLAASLPLAGGGSFRGDVPTVSAGTLKRSVRQRRRHHNTRQQQGGAVKDERSNLLSSRYTIRSGTLSDFMVRTPCPSILALVVLWNPSQDLEFLAGLYLPTLRCTGLGVRSFSASGLWLLGDNLAGLRPPSFSGLQLLLFPGLVLPKTGLVIRVGTPRGRFTGLSVTSSTGVFTPPLMGLEEQTGVCPALAQHLSGLWCCPVSSAP